MFMFKNHKYIIEIIVMKLISTLGENSYLSAPYSLIVLYLSYPSIISNTSIKTQNSECVISIAH